MCLIFFFFNDTATTEIYTLSLHDALPISGFLLGRNSCRLPEELFWVPLEQPPRWGLQKSSSGSRSEEHTSELQSRSDLVCRLLLEKKKENLKTEYRKMATAE